MPLPLDISLAALPTVRKRAYTGNAHAISGYRRAYALITNKPHAKPKQKPCGYMNYAKGTAVPCDTIQSARLDFGKADKATLDATMARLNVPKGSYTLLSNGTLNLTGAASSLTLEQVKQEYSKTVVYSQAKRFGWAVKEQPDGKLQVMKKAF